MSGGRRRPRGLVAREARANLLAWRGLAAVVALAAAMFGGSVAHQTTTSAGDAFTTIQEMDARGRHVLRVTSQAGDLLPTAYCDAIGAVANVTASVGITGGPRVRLSNGDIATIQLVTPGIARLLPVETPADVYVGASRSELAGLADGAWVVIESDDPRLAGAASHQVAVLPQTPRTTTFDDSLLVVVAPTSAGADTCWVEAAAGAASAVSAALGNVGPDGTAIAVAPLHPDIAGRTDPEEQLRSLPGDLMTLVAGAGTAAVLLGWWYVRRQEWALYRSFGFPLGRLAGIATAEWLLVVVLPLVVGVCSGLALSGDGLDGRAYRLGIVNGAVVLLLSAVAVPAWTAWLRRASIARVLRGA